MGQSCKLPVNGALHCPLVFAAPLVSLNVKVGYLRQWPILEKGNQVQLLSSSTATIEKFLMYFCDIGDKIHFDEYGMFDIPAMWQHYFIVHSLLSMLGNIENQRNMLLDVFGRARSS